MFSKKPHQHHAHVTGIARSILWIDCSGAILVGVSMLVLGEWLRSLYALPSALYNAIAIANLCYGAFSLALALLKQRPVKLVSALAIANAVWGCVCLVAAVSVAGRASVFGIMHILGEGAVVFWLAQFEWRHRTLIATNNLS